MTPTDPRCAPRALRRSLRAGACAVLVTLAAGCGGGVDNNAEPAGQQRLSFAYYQRCVEPILVTPLPIPGTSTQNACAAAGCHDNVNGTGGALRLRAAAAPVASVDPLVVRDTDMYRNFYSAQGAVSFGAIGSSRLITKPLVRNTLHGGGLIFATDTDPNVRVLLRWMTNPVPTGQNEFTYDLPGACLPP